MLLSDTFIIMDGIHPFLFAGRYETYSLDCCGLTFTMRADKKLVYQRQVEYDLDKLTPASWVSTLVTVSKNVDHNLLTLIMSNDLFLWNLNKLDKASTLKYEIQFVGLKAIAATMSLDSATENIFRRNIILENTMAKEAVNHPQHYGGEENKYEAIKVIEALNMNFHLGNVFKYISRAGKKSDNEIQDLKKARWYLDRYIQLLESNAANIECIDKQPNDKGK